MADIAITNGMFYILQKNPANEFYSYVANGLMELANMFPVDNLKAIYRTVVCRSYRPMSAMTKLKMRSITSTQITSTSPQRPR